MEFHDDPSDEYDTSTDVKRDIFIAVYKKYQILRIYMYIYIVASLHGYIDAHHCIFPSHFHWPILFGGHDVMIAGVMDSGRRTALSSSRGWKP